MRLILTIPAPLLAQLTAALPPGQSRSEWIREAIRQRLNIDTAYANYRKATNEEGDTPS